MTPPKKSCIRCGVEKLLTDFYKHSRMADGHLGKCSQCCREQATENRRNNQERYNAYDTARKSLPQRIEARAKVTARMKAERPEVYAAHNAVSNAIRDGRLKKQPCEKCGADAHAHHEDYSKPLDVVWLCHTHHMERHRKSPSES